jgi:hypothetical protein
MQTRREFLQSTLAASALPMAVAMAARADTPAAGTPAGADTGASTDATDAQPVCALYKVIYDARFVASRAFAEHAVRRGLPIHEIAGDVTAVWFNDLHPRWQQGAAPIAGLTAPGALFCLERLAWDHRMRCVFHAEHRCLANGAAEHRCLAGSVGENRIASGTDSVLEAELEAAGTAWEGVLASRITHLHSNLCLRPASTPGPTPSGLPRTPNEGSVILVSWIIAPFSRT